MKTVFSGKPYGLSNSHLPLGLPHISTQVPYPATPFPGNGEYASVQAPEVVFDESPLGYSALLTIQTDAFKVGDIFNSVPSIQDICDIILLGNWNNKFRPNAPYEQLLTLGQPTRSNQRCLQQICPKRTLIAICVPLNDNCAFFWQFISLVLSNTGWIFIFRCGLQQLARIKHPLSFVKLIGLMLLPNLLRFCANSASSM